MSNLLSESKLYDITKRCQETCNFCKLTKVDILYNTIKILKYHQIKDFIGFDKILNNYIILSDIIVRYGDNISFDDLIIILEQKTLKDISPSVIFKITHNILKSVSSSPDKIENINKRSLLILQKIVSNENLLIKYYDTVMGFILEMLENSYISKIKELGIQIADFSMLMELELKRIGKVKPDKRDIYYKSINNIIQEAAFFRLSSKFFSVMYLLPSDLYNLVLKKLDNIIEYISYSSIPETSEEIELIIDPLKPFENIQLDDSKETEIFLDLISSRRKTFIEYIADGKTNGYDAGGLSKDFYSIISSEIIKNCEEVDSYLVPKKDSTLHPSVWKFFGIMMGRSIFRETISPALNLHPVICYMLLKGISNIKMKDFFEELEPYYIDYINSMKIILNMNKKEYEEFMELQCEDIVPRSLYVGNYIYSKYLYQSSINFILGFRMLKSRYYYMNYVSMITLTRYIKGDWKYDIIGNSQHSLKNNIMIRREQDYDDQVVAKGTVFYERIEYFKKIFMKVMEDLNNKDIDKLKTFIKFWFGTASINTFNNIKATISITNSNLYGCFKSNTCFNNLHVESIYIKSSSTLYDELLKLIDNTLENQKLSESAGYRMQFM